MSLAQVIAVSNPKGGVGKTTLAVNLACALAGSKVSVALVDNDEQGSATAWAHAGKLPIHCLHLPLGRIEEVNSWAEILRKLCERYDIVIVDFPAAAAPSLAETLLISSLVLIPVTPSGLELTATRRMLRHINRARRVRRDAGPAVLVVPSRVVDAGESMETARGRLALLGQELAPPLQFRREYEAAFTQGLWVGAAYPGSAAHEEIGAVVQLVQERLSHLSPVPWPTKDTAAAIMLRPSGRGIDVKAAATIEPQEIAAGHPAAEVARPVASEPAAGALPILPSSTPGFWRVSRVVVGTSAVGMVAAIGLALVSLHDVLLAEAPVRDEHGLTAAVPVTTTSLSPAMSGAADGLRGVREKLESLVPALVRLKSERDGLRQQVLQLQAELAEMRRKSVVLGPAFSAPELPTRDHARVMIRYSQGVLDDRDKALAHGFAEELTRAGFEVAGIVPVQYRIHKGEVRYFLKQDAPAAGRIAEAGSPVLVRAGSPAGLQPVEQAEEGLKLASGDLEVWLPSVMCEGFCGISVR